jgi:branched-chain amino acid transport system permease protein
MSSAYKTYALWAAGAAFLIVLPLVSGTGLISLYSQIGIAIIFALAYNMLLGQSGLLSFGHAVYFGMGGFFTIQVMSWVQNDLFWLPTPLVPLAGGLFGLLTGMVLGFFSTRRHGTAFAMITLAIAELMVAGALMLNSLSGGEEGISAWRAGWWFLNFGSQLQVYYLVLFWTVLCALLMYGFTLTPFGRITLAVRDNGERAQFIGYNTYLVRFIVFCVSSTFCGVAGGLLAIKIELINYETMGLIDSAVVLINTFMGGAGYFSGPIIGAVLLTTLQLNLSNFTEAWLFYQGILFILMVMYAPTGFAGILYAHAPLLRHRLLLRLLPAYALALGPALVMTLALIFLVEFVFHWSEAFYAAVPVEALGLEWNPHSAWPWLLMAVAFGASGYGLRRTIPIVQERWSEINAAIKERAQP